MSGPEIYLRWPSFTLSALNPDPLPLALPPPTKERSFRAPFGIDKDLFNFALQGRVPLVFAGTYIVSVFLLNAYNRKRNNKPWAIARQKWFQYFVIIHNALLTIYSTATFLAMCRAIAHTWPGLSNKNGLAGVADALCKINGPRGLGDAATFNSTINIWEAKNTVIRLGYDGNPDPTDYGRLWNEGLAFWGWIFYISKFYEVIDTLIILAKGKRSATLQTYHHAGAMVCMWAGIRYMSPPIWMFVSVNSFIHGLMYTYFTLTALGYKVPGSIKRSLTSLQIAQFVWGASYAAIHLFVQYDIPISTPYQVAHTISAIASSATSKAQSATSAISEVIATPSAVAWGALGKKLLLRALGEEGLAEKVHNKQHQPLDAIMEEKIEQFREQIPGAPKYETRWRTEWTRADCLDTTGEAFAVYLNLVYLAPLTFLFARFFYKAYIKRGKARTASQGARKVIDSGKEGETRTEEKVEEAGKRLEGKIAKIDGKDIQQQLRRDIQSLQEGTYIKGRQVSSQIQHLEEQIDNASTEVEQKSKAVVEKTKETIGEENIHSTEQQVQETTEQVKQAGKDVTQQAQQLGKQAAKKAQQASTNVVNQVKEESKSLEAGSLNNSASPSKQSGNATSQNDKWFANENDSNNEQAVQEDTAAKSPSVKQGREDFDAEAERIHKEGTDYIKQQVQSTPFQAPTDGDGKAELLPIDGNSNAESKSKQDSILEASQASRPGVNGDLLGDEANEQKPEKEKGDLLGDEANEQKPERENTAPGLSNNTYASIASLDDEDTDAMGKSGAIIDIAASKAEEAADNVDSVLQARPMSSSSGKRHESPTKLPRKLDSRSQSRSQSPSKKPFAPPGGSGK